ncbi:hypothetical protein SKPI104516_13820 [Skermania piniformis]
MTTAGYVSRVRTLGSGVRQVPDEQAREAVRIAPETGCRSIAPATRPSTAATVAA